MTEYKPGDVFTMNPITFEEATEEKARLEQRVHELGKLLDEFPKGPMGLTPDGVKATDGYKIAKTAFDLAFGNLRAFNSYYTKTFKNELRAARKARGR